MHFYREMALTGDVDTESRSIVSAVPPRSLDYFTDLNPADNSKFIEARVYRKWTAMKVPALIPTGFSCILLDKKVSHDFPHFKNFNIPSRKKHFYEYNMMLLMIGISHTSKFRHERKRTFRTRPADKLCLQNSGFWVSENRWLGKDA